MAKKRKRMITVQAARKRIDRRTSEGREIKDVYLSKGADACLVLCRRYGVTRRAMLLTLAAIEHSR